MISIDEFVSFRLKYCQQHHCSSCKECCVLVEIAKNIVEEGICKVSSLYHKFFPDSKYKSDKAVRRLLKLPVAMFQVDSQAGDPPLYVTGYYPCIDYKRLVYWINKLKVLSPGHISGLHKNTLSALCKLATSDKDRCLLKFAACEAAGLTSRQARKVYGISSYKEIERKVQTAITEAVEIRQAVMEIANIEEQALMKSLRIQGPPSDIESEEEMDMDVDECSAEDYIYTSSDSEELDMEENSSVEASNNVVENERNLATCTEPVNSSAPQSVSRNSVDKSSEIIALMLHPPEKQPDHAYDPDTIDKTTLVGNPAPSHDVLLSWLRDNDLNWFLFYEDVSQYLQNYTSEVLNQVMLDFTDYLPSSDLSENEEKRVEMSRQAFLEMHRRHFTDSQAIQLDSDNDQDSDWNNVEISDVIGKELQEKINMEKLRIKRRAARNISKEIAERCILKKNVPQGVSRLLKQFPNIGKDMEEFVQSKRVGADAWHRTGLLTFDGERKRGKKVTYNSIKEHLEAKYNTRLSYGSIVQLCVVRNKRHLSAKR